MSALSYTIQGVPTTHATATTTGKSMADATNFDAASFWNASRDCVHKDRDVRAEAFGVLMKLALFGPETVATRARNRLREFGFEVAVRAPAVAELVLKDDGQAATDLTAGEQG